jgi:SAM-dependent methyltransferase
MDQPSPDLGLLAESLADLAGLNRYLGGTATILHQMSRLLGSAAPKRLSVLDVGAGGGDILRALARWCERRGIGFSGVALDSSATTSRIAAAMLADPTGRPAARVLCADGRALPFPDHRFDVAISSTSLHHLEPRDAVIVLREMARVSARGIVVSDLRRCPSGFLAALAMAHTVWRRHRYSRHDGPVSMRAAYTIPEARALAEQAGLSPVVEPQPGFRWALRWRRPG